MNNHVSVNLKQNIHFFYVKNYLWASEIIFSD